MTVTLSDGRRIALSRSAGRRAITLPTLMRGLGARVTVMAVGPDGNPRALPRRTPRPHPLPDGCMASPPLTPQAVLSYAGSIDLARLKPGTIVKITVRAMTSDAKLGPAGTGRYKATRSAARRNRPRDT